jgi:hypothetical protein
MSFYFDNALVLDLHPIISKKQILSKLGLTYQNPKPFQNFCTFSEWKFVQGQRLKSFLGRRCLDDISRRSMYHCPWFPVLKEKPNSCAISFYLSDWIQYLVTLYRFSSEPDPNFTACEEIATSRNRRRYLCLHSTQCHISGIPSYTASIRRNHWFVGNSL